MESNNIFDVYNRHKGPTLYKVIFKDNVYALGILSEDESKRELSSYYTHTIINCKYGTENEPEFSRVFESRTAIEDDLIMPITTLDEGFALMEALNNGKYFFNRKKRKFIPKENAYVQSERNIESAVEHCEV